VVCSCSFAALADGEGAVLASFQDVTDHRRTEAELIKTMEFLESLIDASVDAIVAADMKGTIILFNHGAERIYGHRAADVLGKMSATRLYPGEGAHEVMRRIRSKAYGGPGRLEPTQMEALTASGERIPIQISAAMIYERGEAVATFGIFTDLRERRHVEERLAQAQEKLAVSERQALIAELAGTAAHELNQPLTSVLAHAELLVRKLGRESPVIGAAETMMREAQRMAEIVRKIGQITKYETTSYVGAQKILDLDRASGSESARANYVGYAEEEEKASGE
jgi:PAS domain S-box-containing protein